MACLPPVGAVDVAPISETELLFLRDNPIFLSPRKPTLIGNHMGESFQLFPEGDGLCMDHIPVPFSAAACCSALPYIGRYGDVYEMNRHLMVIKVPLEWLVSIPDEVKVKLSDGLETDVYVMVHDKPERPHEDLNMVYHGWVYPDKPAGYNESHPVTMGIFCCDGVVLGPSAHNIPMNDLSPVAVHVHDGRCSPNNARFHVDPAKDVSSFWSIAKDGGRQVLSYHIITMDDMLNESVKMIVGDDRLITLTDVVNVKVSDECQPLVSKFMRKLLSPFMPAKCEVEGE